MKQKKREVVAVVVVVVVWMINHSMSVLKDKKDYSDFFLSDVLILRMINVIHVYFNFRLIYI
jgi:hypothetical protein